MQEGGALKVISGISAHLAKLTFANFPIDALLAIVKMPLFISQLAFPQINFVVYPALFSLLIRQGICNPGDDIRYFSALSILRPVQRLGFFREPSREITNCLRVDFGLIPLLQNDEIGRAFGPGLTRRPTIAFQIVCRRSERIEPTMD
jgi:hypothetical protein